MPDGRALHEPGKMRGRCSVCGYSVALRKDGMVASHLLYGIGFGGRALHCLGDSRPPLADAEKPTWESPHA